MNIKADKKFRFVHMKLGIKQDYTNLLKENSFTDSEQDILLQASIDVNSPEPNDEFIYKAYDILHPKKTQTTPIKNRNTKRTHNTKNSKLMMCPDCKENISKSTDLCPNCGLSLDIEKNDKLSICNNCKSKVYKSREICPNCQSDLRAQRQKKLKETIIGISAIIVLSVIVISFPSLFVSTKKVEEKPTYTPEQLESKKQQKALYRKNSDAMIEVILYLKSNLRDPDSYESIEWSPLVENDDATYGLRHKYRAINGFGGMNVETRTFLFSSYGTIIAVK